MLGSLPANSITQQSLHRLVCTSICSLAKFCPFFWEQGMDQQAHFPGENTEAPTGSEKPPQSNNLG